MLVEYFDLQYGGKIQRSRTRDGVALRVLCGQCNSRYGSSLGTGFAEFAKQVQRSGKLISPSGGVFVSALDTFPGRVLRHLFLNFLSVQSHDDEGKWDNIREFIRSRRSAVPMTVPKVSLYFNPSNCYRIVPLCSVGSLGSNGRNWAGAEIAAPGLGALFTVSDDAAAFAYFIGAEPLDISSWSESEFDSRRRVTVTLPRLRVEAPHPIGFGRPIDVERWRTSKHILWGVGTAADPTSLTSVAALWRADR